LEKVGALQKVDVFLPFPDLSDHVVTLDPDKVSVGKSAASNHNAQFEIWRGLNETVAGSIVLIGCDAGRLVIA
jgi:hypothetical protein